MHTLAAERGLGVLSQQLNVERQLTQITEVARKLGADTDPMLRQQLAGAWSGVRIMRWNALRAISDGLSASVLKLHWGPLYRRIGELAMAVLGAGALVDTEFHSLFLFTRSTTIYGGSDEIQRNIIGEQVLGLPREPR
jgi:alkylation response protein AidB-like acyl-CoA dehydrogenase